MSEQLANTTFAPISQEDQRAAAQLKALKTNIEPRTDLFENVGAAMSYEHDPSRLEFVNNVSNNAWAQAERIAADMRLTPQAKAEDIGAITAKARQDITEAADYELERVIAEIPKAIAASQRSLSVSPDEAVALNYLRESLTARVASKELNYQDVVKLWQTALEANDLPALRVFHDNGPTLITAAMGGKVLIDQKTGRAYMGGNVEALRTQTDDALRTPEQRAAAKKARQLEATRIKLIMARNNAHRRFERPQIGRDGKLMTAAQATPMFKF